MACTCAPTLVRARKELDGLFPNRSKASDGCCGDPAHQARVSDHNPTDGFAHAIDFTNDIAAGVNCQRLVDYLVRIRDPRVKYIIWNGRIIKSYVDGSGRPAWIWQKYTGQNQHTAHCHISINTKDRNSTAAWWSGLGGTMPDPAKTQLDRVEERGMFALDALGRMDPEVNTTLADINHVVHVLLDELKAVKADVAELKARP